jgi:DNA-directed RNA polymerase I subunit RPA2
MTANELVRNAEERTEVGGYFILNGIERIIRLLVVPRRDHVRVHAHSLTHSRLAALAVSACIFYLVCWLMQPCL